MKTRLQRKKKGPAETYTLITKQSGKTFKPLGNQEQFQPAKGHAKSTKNITDKKTTECKLLRHRG